MNIGQKIKALREQAGLSKGKLADLADLSAAYIGQLEAGIKQPTIETLSRICEALGLTLVEFFNGCQPSLPPDLRQLLREAESLTPEQRKKLVEFIRSMKGGS